MTLTLFLGIALTIIGPTVIALELCVFAPQAKRMDAEIAAINANTSAIKARTAAILGENLTQPRVTRP